MVVFAAISGLMVVFILSFKINSFFFLKKEYPIIRDIKIKICETN